MHVVPLFLCSSYTTLMYYSASLGVDRRDMLCISIRLHKKNYWVPNPWFQTLVDASIGMPSFSVTWYKST